MERVLLKLLFLVLWIYVAVDAAKSADLECTYLTYQKSGYTCAVIAKTFKANDVAVIFTGDHSIGKSEIDVKYVAFCLSIVEVPPSEIFEIFPNIQQLNVEVSRMRMIERNSLKGANKLVKLFARGNYVTRLESDVFAEAFNLKVINLHDNSISNMSENAFRSLVRLEQLWISKNWISSLHTNIFSDLINLREVYLHSNRIEQLPEGLFRNNLKIKKIVLANNKIKIVPETSFKSLVQLEQVNFISNICVHNIFGRSGKYVPLNSLQGTIKNCTQANTLEAKNQLLINELEALKLSGASLKKDYNDDYNSEDEEYDEDERSGPLVKKIV